MICTIDESKYRIQTKVVKEQQDKFLGTKVIIKKKKTDESVLDIKNPIEIKEMNEEAFLVIRHLNNQEKSLELYKKIQGQYIQVFHKNNLKFLGKLSDNIYFGQMEKLDATGSFFYLAKENKIVYPNVFFEVKYTRFDVKGHPLLEGKLTISKKNPFLKQTVEDTLIITMDYETIQPVLIWSEEQQIGREIPNEMIQNCFYYSKKNYFKEIANSLLNEDNYLETLFKEKEELTKREKESIKLLLKRYQ